MPCSSKSLNLTMAEFNTMLQICFKSAGLVTCLRVRLASPVAVPASARVCGLRVVRPCVRACAQRGRLARAPHRYAILPYAAAQRIA